MADETGTPTTLEWFVQAVDDDAPFAAESAADGKTMVLNIIGAENPYGVPENIVARACLEVGADLYYRKASRNGVATFGGGDMPSPEPFRINRDPMQAAYPILRPFLPAFGL
jgi:hypothetical protein